MDYVAISQVAFDAIAIMGTIFGAYNYYIRNREKDGHNVSSLEKGEMTLRSQIELLESKLTGEMKNLATALGGEMKNLTTEFNFIKLNHLHTIEETQKRQEDDVKTLTGQIIALTTIIDERVPRKTVDSVK